MSNDSPWWTQRYGAAAELDPAFAGAIDEHAEAQIDLVERLVGVSGARVLDLGCGAGRHAILLQERGYEVTGVDLAPSLLDLARRVWADRHGDAPGPAFVEGDMRTPPASGPFDAALLMDATLGVFDDDSDHLRVLTAVADRLTPGGKLVVELLNPYFWANHRVTRHYPQGALAASADLVRTYRFDGLRGRLTDRLTVFGPDGRWVLPTQSLRCWTPPEIKVLCTAAGFQEVEVFGSDGWRVPSDPRGLDAAKSVYLWVVARL